ncbi:amino acid ABC transporter substrate-binding protein [Ferrovibrio terrae]|uniref:Amino acid ABC transporter substrate-binding protein n=1 Tax=Ferrovibrio terrae TaxID=2594003 RepID=A0A516GZY7_9PROT|nr:transporter substrate-binding domain-containing protein [Ferrovibrio terrae]QDO96900.1 amino acid ABC transporter substrate-binding protein [Ferrovibrio terrae]
MVPAATAQTDISIGFRASAPYVIRANDGSLSGLEYELVMQAAGATGIKPRAVLTPFGRLPEDFRRGSIQAFVPANPAMNLPGCISDTVLVYRNMAFSLQSRALSIASATDLAALDVTAFQNAQLLLGPGVGSLMLNPDRYREVANQMLQVRALFSGRTDVVLAERRIFRYMMRSPEAGVNTDQPLTEHDIFPPTHYGVAFQRQDDCISFNRGLAAIRRSGVYDEVLRRWDSGPQARSGARPVANPAG